MGRLRPGPRDPGPAATFVAPVDPKPANGSPAYEYGSQVANLKTLLWWASLLKSLCRYKTDMAMCSENNSNNAGVVGLGTVGVAEPVLWVYAFLEVIAHHCIEVAD